MRSRMTGCAPSWRSTIDWRNRLVETERLYFEDPYRTKFSARVVQRADLGGRPAVLLDSTAFYPEGGGQPAATGTLNGTPVVDVQGNEAGGSEPSAGTEL